MKHYEISSRKTRGNSQPKRRIYNVKWFCNYLTELMWDTLPTMITYIVVTVISNNLRYFYNNFISNNIIVDIIFRRRCVRKVITGRELFPLSFLIADVRWISDFESRLLYLRSPYAVVTAHHDGHSRGKCNGNINKSDYVNDHVVVMSFGG